MAQATWRGEDELLERVRRSARARGWSVNAWMTAVFDAATNPRLAGTETEQLRERLLLAGLVDEPRGGRERPSPARVARARKAAASGTPVSDLVIHDRR